MIARLRSSRLNVMPVPIPVRASPNAPNVARVVSEGGSRRGPAVRSAMYEAPTAARSSGTPMDAAVTVTKPPMRAARTPGRSR